MDSKTAAPKTQQSTDVVPLIPVLFDQDTLLLVEQNAQPPAATQTPPLMATSNSPT